MPPTEYEPPKKTAQSKVADISDPQRPSGGFYLQDNRSATASSAVIQRVKIGTDLPSIPLSDAVFIRWWVNEGAGKVDYHTWNVPMHRAIAALMHDARNVEFESKEDAVNKLYAGFIKSEAYKQFTAENALAELEPATVINAHEYDAINFIASDIIQKFPPDATFYVEMGRSPVPIIEEMRRLSSAVKFAPLPLGGVVKGNSEEIMANEHYLSKVFEHFPEPRALSGKVILLMDYVSSGASMDLTEKIMQLRFRESRIHVYEIAKKPTAGPADRAPRDGMYSRGPAGTDHRLRGMPELISKMAGTDLKRMGLTRSEYKKYGEGGEYNLELRQNTKGIEAWKRILASYGGESPRMADTREPYKKPAAVAAASTGGSVADQRRAEMRAMMLEKKKAITASETETNFVTEKKAQGAAKSTDEDAGGGDL